MKYRWLSVDDISKYLSVIKDTLQTDRKYQYDACKIVRKWIF